jgi:hypothetical protein
MRTVATSVFNRTVVSMTTVLDRNDRIETVARRLKPTITGGSGKERIGHQCSPIGTDANVA